MEGDATEQLLEIGAHITPLKAVSTMNASSDAGLLQARIIAGAALFGVSAISIVLPVLYRRRIIGNGSPKQRIIPFFASGALFGLSAMHLLPESIEEMDDLSFNIADKPFNPAGAVVSLGFLCMLALDSLIHYFGSLSFIGTGHSTPKRRSSSVRIQKMDGVHGASDLQQEFLETEFKDAFDIEAGKMGEDKFVETDADSELEKHNIKSSTYFATIVTFMLLFIHSVFDGFAVGTRSTVANVWITAGVVSAHKIIVCITLGISFVLAEMNLLQIFYLGSIFSFATPTGIILYAFVFKSTTAEAVLSSFSAGALLFVSFEMSNEQAHKTISGVTRLLRIIAFMCGLGVLVAASILEAVYGHAHY